MKSDALISHAAGVSDEGVCNYFISFVIFSGLLKIGNCLEECFDILPG